jgi:hypothetical protein
MKKKSYTKIIFALILFVGSFSFVVSKTNAATISTPANNLGLVGYWSFNEGTSTTATDFSGNNNTGSIINMDIPATATSGWGNGKFGKGLNFDGAGDYVTMDGVANDVSATSFAFSIWIKPSWTAGFDTVLAVNTAALGNQTQIFIDNTLTVRVYDGTQDATELSSSGSVVDGKWHHVVYSRSGATGTLYVDGVSQGTHNNSDTFTGTDLWSLGQEFDGGPNPSDYFQGSMDEVRIYSRPLAQADVTALYRTGLTTVNSAVGQLSVVPNGLIGYWTLDGGKMTDTLAYDSSSSGNTLTTQGGATKTVGKVGQSLNMDAVDDVLFCTDANCGGTTGGKLDMGSRDFTLMAWINPESGGSSCNLSGRVVGKIGDDEPEGYYFGIGNQYICAAIRRSGEVSSTADGSTVPLNEWSHIAVVFDRDGNMTRYLNGVQTGTQDNISAQAGSVDHPLNFCIGGRDGGAGCIERMFDGRIDEVRVYERVLTVGEIKQVYNASAGAKINSSQNVAQGSSLNSGLIGLWSFNGLDLTDRVYDRSVSANHGYINGVATSTAKTTGKLGQGLSFDGIDDYVYLGDPASIRPSNLTYITMSAWIKNDSFINANYLIAKDDGVGTNATNMSFRNTAEARCGVGGTSVTSSGLGLLAGVWYNFTCTYDGSNIIMYVNGVNVVSTAKTGAIADSAGNPWIIGGRGLPGGDIVLGKLDEVRLYDRPLTATEVKQLYLLGR